MRCAKAAMAKNRGSYNNASVEHMPFYDIVGDFGAFATNVLSQPVTYLDILTIKSARNTAFVGWKNNDMGAHFTDQPVGIIQRHVVYGSMITNNKRKNGIKGQHSCRNASCRIVQQRHTPEQSVQTRKMRWHRLFLTRLQLVKRTLFFKKVRPKAA